MKKYREAIERGMNNPEPVNCYGGCARVYVVAAGREHAAELEKAAKEAGMKFQKKGHYGLQNAMYVGYDMGNKRVLGQAESIVKNLEVLGIKCYVDGMED